MNTNQELADDTMSISPIPPGFTPRNWVEQKTFTPDDLVRAILDEMADRGFKPGLEVWTEMHGVFHKLVAALQPDPIASLLAKWPKDYFIGLYKQSSARQSWSCAAEIRRGEIVSFTGNTPAEAIRVALAKFADPVDDAA
jgi:hypothetical protein